MEFDWDDGNRDKNLYKHGVRDWEIEEALRDPQRIAIRRGLMQQERREVFLGRSARSVKYLRVVVTYRIRHGRRWVRPISAVEMNATEKRRYSRRRR